MGLTIHYQLETSTRSPDKARGLIEKLRRKALDLPFKQVGELVEAAGEQADYDKLDKNDPNRWLLIQAGQYLEVGNCQCSVSPLHLIAFSTLPADGSEPANFGLATYPKSIEVQGKRVRTGL